MQQPYDDSFPSIWRDTPASRKRWVRLQNSYRFLQSQPNLSCRYCGLRPLTIYSWDDPAGTNAPDKATVDHVIPVSRGGPDVFDNMVVSCFPCNQRKGVS